MLAKLTAAMAVGFLMLAVGCARWDPEKSTSQSFRVPSGRMAPDSVSLELAVAQLSDSKKQDLEQLWLQLDQQKTPLQVRKLLDENGFRIAVIPSQIPETLHKLLEPEEIES